MATERARRKELTTAEDWQALANSYPPEQCPKCGGLALVRYETGRAGRALVRGCPNGHRTYINVGEASGAFRDA